MIGNRLRAKLRACKTLAKDRSVTGYVRGGATICNLVRLRHEGKSMNAIT